ARYRLRRRTRVAGPARQGHGPPGPHSTPGDRRARGDCMIRLLIADDHPIVREGLRRIAAEQPGVMVVAEASSADEGLLRVADAPVDVMLLDVSMPGPTFIEVLQQVKKDHQSVKVLVLSVHPEDQWAVRALRAGAAGYLTKDHSPEQLVEAIRK